MQPTKPALDFPAHLHEKAREKIAARSQPDPSGCILWTGPLDRDGYGRFYFHGSQTGAHRAAWILERGAIPDASLVLDHLCRNHTCLNVDHLELVTVRENTIRGDLTWRPGRRVRSDRRPLVTDERVACVHGHPWAENFVEVITKRGSRQIFCRTCTRISRRKTAEKQRAARREK